LGYPEAYRIDILDNSGTWSTAYEATGVAKTISTATYSNGYHTLNFSSAHGIKFLDDIKLSFNDKIYTVASVPTTTSLTIYTGTSIGSITGTVKVVNLSDGILDIYYDPATTSWGRFTPFMYSPDEKTVNDFSNTNTQTKFIKGVRFVATKMSAPNIPLEMIELSPRLVGDITNNTTAFEISSSLGQSSFGLPIGNVVSSSGSITLSDTDKYFNKNNSSSILQNILKPNVEIKLYQKLTVQEIDYRFPLKTMYTNIWNDGSDFTVSSSLEDYFKFFKETSAPDIMIANGSGVKTSVAILMLLDNIGFNGFRFDKTNTLSGPGGGDQEDVVLDFFYSKKEQNVMEVLESLAVSTQTSIYMDVDNELVAMTKEKVLSSSEKDFWMIGNDNTTTLSTKTGVDSTSVTNIGYIANIQSYRENSEEPITDISVQYTGNGLEKKSFQLMDTSDDKKKDILETPTFGASIVNRDIRYTTDVAWKTGNDKNSSDNYLAAASLIKDLVADRPMTEWSGSEILITAKDKYDAIKKFYASAPSGKKTGKDLMSITLDKDLINTFTNNYSGYVLVDSELIRYNGIQYRIFDPLSKTLKTKIIFTKEEYSYERSQLKQGGSIEPVSLILHLEMTAIFIDNINKSFTIVGDGRGQKNTKSIKHEALATGKPFLTAHPDWKKFGVKLYDTTNNLSKSIINAVTATDRIDTHVSNKTVGGTGTVKTIPGYLKLSGPKSSISKKTKSTIKESTATKKGLPINSSSEQIISGIFKNVRYNTGVKDGSGNFIFKNVPIRRLGTRMRLFSDVPKNVDAGEKLIKDGVIAGVAWNIIPEDNDSSGTNYTGFQGYVVEIEEVGTIDAASILDAKYRNLRFYKVYKDDGIHKFKLFGNAWVNVSSTPNASSDSVSTSGKNTGKSYAQIFDLEVVIRKSKTGYRTYYEIFWENQSVLEANEITSNALPENSRVGLITRGASSAMYEYFYALSTPDDFNIKDSASVFTKGTSGTFSELAQRGLLPERIKYATNTKAKVPYRGIFEDFAKTVREVKKFDVRYDYPSLAPSLISLAEYNPNYYVSDFETSNFGASFWLYNTSNGPIQIDEDNYTPLFVVAFPLKNIMGGTLQSSKYIESAEEDKIINDIYDVNRGLYGKKEIILSGEYLNNFSQARSLADWVVTNLSKERKTINIESFCNPLFELGDKVGILYSDKDITDQNKTYTVTSINYSVSNSGPTMSLEIKECV
jgi:hypothetical protein